MSRPRKSRQDLPSRVYWKHNSYFFVDRDNKWHRLGKGYAEAMLAYATLLESDTSTTTMGSLFDRYQLEIIPKKAPETQRSNHRQLAKLRHAFGRMRPNQIKAKHLYQYADARKAPVSANREWSLMSQVFKHGIKWGLCEENPCVGLMRHKEKPRDRYVKHEEFLAVLAIAPPVIQCAMALAYLTALRPGDLLRLQRQNLTKEGVAVTLRKTGRKMVFEWTDDLRAAVKRAQQLPTDVASIHLITQPNGQRYSESAFRTKWRRLVKRAVRDRVLTETFEFRDIRPKSASDSEDDQLLGHLDARTLQKHYKRKPLKVKPLDMVKK
jgi:integrase